MVRERFGGVGLVFAFSRGSLALALAERGEFVEAVVRCTEGIQIAEAVGHSFSVTVTYRGMGLLHLRRGNLHQATLALEHALEICQGVDSPPLFHAVRSALGYAYALSGRSAEAIPLLEEAVGRPVMGSTQEGKSLRTISLSEAYLLAGREADARAAAQRALGLARQHKERGHEAYTLRLLGEIAARENSSMSTMPRTTIAKLSPSLKNLVCARSSRIATLVLANCIGGAVICDWRRSISTTPSQ